MKTLSPLGLCIKNSFQGFVNLVHFQTDCLALYSLPIDLTYVVVIVSKTQRQKRSCHCSSLEIRVRDKKKKGLFQERNLYEDETTIETQSIVNWNKRNVQCPLSSHDFAEGQLCVRVCVCVIVLLYCNLCILRIKACYP